MSNTNYRVLVIEDETSWQHFFRDTISAMGHVVEVASDFDAGRKAIANQSYDLVLLDVALDQPRFNVLCQQFCDILRNGYPDVPFLAMSGKNLTNKDIVTLFRDYRPYDFIAKGNIELSVLRHQIESALRSANESHAVASISGLPRLPVTKPESPTVVLLTVNEHETSAVLEVFTSKDFKANQTTQNRVTYSDLGIHAGMRIVHTICEMGAGGVGAAQQRTRAAIEAWKPAAIIAVGIAFGMDELKQKIGDVLVASQIQDYELGRLGNDGTVTPRGDRPGTSDPWRNRFRQLDANQKLLVNDWPTVRFGLVLSGQKLIDNLNYRDSLRSLHAEAIGGEMEGVGLYASAAEAKVDWIVVKGICDWGHNKNNADKESWQKIAACNAARVLKAAIDLGNLYR